MPKAQPFNGASEVIATTGNHPFFVEGLGWTHVDELVPSDLVPSTKAFSRSARSSRRTASKWSTNLGSTSSTGIRGELGGEVLDMTVGQALKHDSKTRKPLTDSRFAK